MFRKAFSILFLFVMLLAGTGLSYMAGEHFIRHEAVARENAVIIGNMATESLTFSADAFHKLKCEKISDRIYEIVYNGTHYDIYSTVYHSDGSVTLSAFNDAQEKELLISMQEKESTGNNTWQTLPFFFFQFYNESNSIQLFTTELSILHTEIHLLPIQPEKGCDSPPPDLMFA